MKTAFVLHHLLHYPFRFPCRRLLTVAPPRHRQWKHLQPPPLGSSTVPSYSFHLHRRFNICCRRLDSNAENFRTQNFDFSFDSQDDDEDEEEENDGGTNKFGEVLEEFIDDVWIFKVFKSFGWFLPLVILSFLLATGLKAFLLALALPIGQSALSLTYRELWGKTQRKSSRTKTRRRPKTRTTRNFGFEGKNRERKSRRDRRPGYQSWVAGSQDSSGFGGWDELDDEQSEIGIGSPRRSEQDTVGSRRVVRKTEMPLLLRLLIAFFPFLASWTKIL